MQSTFTFEKSSNKMDVVGGCGHCRNLGLTPWSGHNVRSCKVLAETNCSACKNKGHTSGYCPKKKGEKFLPVANGWALAAKKAITPQDKSHNDACEAKIKKEQAEKKRKEHEDYLKRKERREIIAKEKETKLKKSYKLFCQHMWYKYGPGYIGHIRLEDAPECFHQFIENDKYEVEKLEWAMEEAERREIKAMEIAREAEKIEMKRKLPPAEYQEWKFNRTHDDIDEWLDEGFCQYSHNSYMFKLREDNAKVWLEAKQQSGEIVLGKDGKYKYFAIV